MKVIFEASDGRTVELYGNPYRLYHFEGFGEVESETQMQRAPFQDGATYVDSVLQSRSITLEVRINAKNEKELVSLRSYLASIFNPKLGLGKLTRIIGDDVKEIECVSDSLPFFPEGAGNRGRTFQKALINLTAPNSYWKSRHRTSTALQAYVGNFKLPFTLPFELGVEGDSTVLINEGDIPTPVLIDIRGPTMNPKIINRTTGEFVKVNRYIEEDEILHIDTTPGQKKVLLIKNSTITNVMGDLAYDSDFFMLEVGENRIEHVADAGDANALVAITWQNLYVGV